MTIAIAPRFTALCALVLAVAAGSGTASPAPGPPWAWPIAAPHPVVAPFAAPETPFASGHRGIDIAVVPGAPVITPADGMVTFSGTVVDRPLVVIRHDDGLVSSIEPVIGSVPVGTSVVRGSPLGVVDRGGHCADACVHFGVRLDGAYVNPLTLLGEVPAAVLLPLG